MLIHFGVIPYIVFDGDYLPSKAATEVERAKRRADSKKKGLELYRLNKPSQAHLELQKAVDVTPEMARQLIDELKKIGVQYVVAPYEADAQLAFLERKGIIQGMISEDSDLLVFGAKRLLTKLDQYGDCIEISRADFTACREISLVGWTDAEFRRMAILSGCDYLASINKMGLKTAYRYVRKYKTIEKIIQMLQFDGQYHIPTGYLQAFYKAELTFLHQRVFCPEKNDLVMMTELATEAHPEDFSFIGPHVEQEVAVAVAKGELDPMTKTPIFVRSAVKTTPNTPWGRSLKDSIDSSSAMKPNMSIQSFFKTKRTPLAELDPNKFTPSPTQERLLQHAGGTEWESSPAPNRPVQLQMNRSLPSSALRSALSTSASQSVKSTKDVFSAPIQQKRRRLCVDPEDSQELSNAVSFEDGRSRFFSSAPADPSPSVQITRNKKTKKNTDITIWSDDSIEDAMADLADLSEISSPFKEGQGPAWTGTRQDKTVEEDSQSATASRGTVTSEKYTCTISTDTSSQHSFVAKTFGEYIAAELKALAKNFAYQPETGRVAAQADEIKEENMAGDPVIGSQPNAKPALMRQRSMTPLQRLGVGALNRSRSCSGLSAESASKNQVTILKRDSKNDTSSTPRLPFAHSMGPDATFAKGSEDAIIPDSEDSADDATSVSEAEVATKQKIDFERFTFNG